MRIYGAPALLIVIAVCSAAAAPAVKKGSVDQQNVPSHFQDVPCDPDIADKACYLRAASYDPIAEIIRGQSVELQQQLPKNSDCGPRTTWLHRMSRPSCAD